MTVELVAALCTGIVSIIAAIGALVTSLKNGRAIKADGVEKDKKLQEIHVLVNSRLTEALEEVAGLKKYIVELTGNKPVAEAITEKAKADAKITTEVKVPGKDARP